MDHIKPQFFKSQKEAPLNAQVIDIFDSALEELFFITYPKEKHHSAIQLREKKLRKFLSTHRGHDIWIYYPWKNILIHSPSEKLYFTLRTARNRNIITIKEQSNYHSIKVGIVGLSVGSAILVALVRSGGPKTIKLADFDKIEVTNLNRINANLLDVGTNKALVAAQEVWKIDPFAVLDVWQHGVNERNLKEFIARQPKLDIFIDEMDDIPLKILARVICKKHKIPVVMATDNGDSVLIDVERFDLEPQRNIFHGMIDGQPKKKYGKRLTYKQWLTLATKIVSAEYLTSRMQSSLLEIGNSIPAVPQLGTTASLAGSAISYVVRRIANGQDMPSGRYQLNLEEKLMPNYNTPQNIQAREKKTKEFISKFGA